jgi:hypothetical protein
MVRTALPEAVINVVLAINTVPSGIASASVRVHTILAASIPTILPEAAINVGLALVSLPPGLASARVRVDAILAASIPTILPRAIISVGLALVSLPPGIACTGERVVPIGAVTMSRAVFVCTLVHALGCRQPARGAGWKIRVGRASAFDG